MADSREPKKETVRITLPPRVPPNPAEAASNRRDTVRINLPSRPPANGIAPKTPTFVPTPASAIPPIPPRPPVSPPPSPLPPAPANPVSAPTFLPPQSPASSVPRPPSSASVPLAAAKPAAMPTTETQPVSPGPKKETARITVLPDPPKSSGAVQMKKTQPLISMPAATAPVTPVTMAPKEAIVKVDAIPMPLCWILLGASAVILLIQIWNYLS